MKTVKQLENEKEILESELLADFLINNIFGNHGWKKRFEKLHALNTLINFLKTNPTEDFIKKQIEVLEQSISYTYLHYIPLDPLYSPRDKCLKHKREYMNFHAIKETKFQLKNLKYLLS